MKKVRRFFAAMIFLLLGCLQQNAAMHTLAAASSRPMRSLSAEEIVSEMGTGWNLGNTMDGHTGFTPGETTWQSVVTTKELISAIHDMGFNTVRVPVTWGTMIDDENDYQIDEKWMSRVQDIVDYAVSQDMYVIINIHHDGAEQTGWLRVASDDVDYVNEKFAAVWEQIAETFRDYDEHLIFESMNEVKGDDDTTAGILRDYERINELNQIFVDTVRSTGGNNAERWLSVPGRYTNIDSTTNESYGFTLPDDTAIGRLFVSIHYYDYSFGLVETTGKTTFSYENAEDLAKDVEKLYESFTSQGIPVIMGEYGCINKDNASERAYHLEVVNRLCAQNGIVPVYWDQGWYDRSESPDYSFSLIDRDTLEIIDKEVTDAIFRGYYVEGDADLADIEKSPEIVEISSITSDTHGASLKIGEETTFLVETVPESTNDVVLWTTSDAAVATASAGHVIARGIGQAQITAYAQSGGAEYTFFVTVTAEEETAVVVSIQTDEILHWLSTQEENPDSEKSDAGSSGKDYADATSQYDDSENTDMGNMEAESDLSDLSDDGEALDDDNAGKISLEVGEYFFLADFVSLSLENEEAADSQKDTSDTVSGTEEKMDTSTEVSSEYVCYCSDNESAATVSTIGKVLAVGTGTAYITVTASSGAEASICVSVEEAAVEKVLTLALNVYYNDDALEYYSNEYGSAISVEEDGQYTLVFDCSEDLSDAAVSAGVMGLNNLTAVYIKDHAVTLGEASDTPVVSCDIFFDAVVVDGTPLTITQTESKSALKNSGILDTNDPLNSWDGSLVEEVTVDNHVLNLVGIDNPQRIEVTFTISNLVFED